MIVHWDGLTLQEQPLGAEHRHSLI